MRYGQKCKRGKYKSKL